MSHINKVFMAASVAVVQSHGDQGRTWRSGLSSLQLTKRRFAACSGTESPDLRPLAGVVGSDLEGVMGEDRRAQADDSIRKVMYLNCWGQG